MYLGLKCSENEAIVAKMKKLLFASIFAVATMAVSSAETIYMTLTGQKQGPIRGGVVQKGRENSIKVLAASHSIVSPRDSASGLPTGKRQHKPYIVTIGIDKAMPLLYNALVNNENLTEVVLKFWTPQTKAATGAGAEVNLYTVKLTSASIASIEYGEPSAKDSLTADATLTIAFTYQKIEWTYNEGGVTAMDDWSTRN